MTCVLVLPRRDTLLDINGVPMIITGMYSYGINTEQEMLVPNMEAPHGQSTHDSVCPCMYVVCACVTVCMCALPLVQVSTSSCRT